MQLSKWLGNWYLPSTCVADSILYYLSVICILKEQGRLDKKAYRSPAWTRLCICCEYLTLLDWKEGTSQ